MFIQKKKKEHLEESMKLGYCHLATKYNEIDIDF